MVKAIEEAVRNRQARVKHLIDLLEKNPHISLEQIIAKCSIETGVSEYTVKRYLQVLKRAGYNFGHRIDELQILGI